MLMKTEIGILNRLEFEAWLAERQGILFGHGTTSCPIARFLWDKTQRFMTVTRDTIGVWGIVPTGATKAAVIQHVPMPPWGSEFVKKYDAGIPNNGMASTLGSRALSVLNSIDE